MQRCLSVLALLVVPGLARAGGNVCFHDGKPIDDRTTQKPFTGEYTCKDMDSGQVTLREHRVADVQEGDYTKYDSRNGKVDETGTYRHGKLHGSLKRYRDGVPYLEYHYVDGVHTGVQKQFEAGKLQRLYVIDDAGKLGNEITFNPKGQPVSIGCNDRPIEERDRGWCGQNGKQSTVTLYDAEGRKSEVRQYLDGKEHGLAQRFHVRTGKLVREAKYDHGKHLEDGERMYDPSGRLLYKVDCAPPERTTCTSTRMFEEVDAVQNVTVRAGRMLKQQTDYYQNGKSKRTLTTDGDHYRIAEYDDRGNVQRRGTYLTQTRWSRDDYVPDGVVEQFDESGGVVVSRETYVRGELDGPSVTTHDREGHRVRHESQYGAGKLLSDRVFVDDKPIRESTFFPDGSVKDTKEFGAAPFKI